MSSVPRKRIVVVDDDWELNDRLEQLFAERYDISFTADWAELSNLFFRGKCDLVLMDVNLPVLKGDRLVQILKGTSSIDKSVRRPRIVYYSAEDESTLAKLVIETGADGYLTKSVRGPELLKNVERFLA